MSEEPEITYIMPLSEISPEDKRMAFRLLVEFYQMCEMGTATAGTECLISDIEK